MPDDDHVQTGRLRRLSRLAYLTARTTGDLLAQQARRKLGGESSPDLRKAAERILGTLGELKGAALKLGQALAMDPDALPAEARRIVAKLLAQAPQRMSFDQVSEVVRAESQPAANRNAARQSHNHRSGRGTAPKRRRCANRKCPERSLPLRPPAQTAGRRSARWSPRN